VRLPNAGISRMELKPLHFIGEAIKVGFDGPPGFEKKPECPARFVWRGKTYTIVDQLNEWHDYGRRGRMAKNMRPDHAATAERRGSWGVGKDYFRVRTGGGRIFDLYFDRAPKTAEQRKGAWYLYRELAVPEHEAVPERLVTRAWLDIFVPTKYNRWA
jgi:hypothetical protein